MIWRWLCCLALAASAVVEALEEPPPAPDLRALDAGWWAYFEPAQPLAASDLKARIAKNRDSLEQLMAGLNDKQGKHFPLFVQQVNEGLERFVKLRDLSLTPPSIALPLDQYSLAGAQARFMVWRELRRTYELEQSDLEWQQAQLATGRKRQAKRRGEYLNLREADPQRLTKAISLMASRVNLELTSLQNKQQGAKLAIVAKQLGELGEELASIRLKLVPSPNAVEVLGRRQAQAQSKADALHEKAIAHNATSLLEESLDSDGLKYRTLVNTTIEIDSAIYALAAKRYQLMALLEGRLATQQATEKQGALLRETVKKFDEFSTAIQQQALFWRSLNLQTRKFLTLQSTALAGEQGALLQRMNTQLEANDLSLEEFELESDKARFIGQIALATVKDDAGWLDRGLFAMDAGFEQGWDKLVQWLSASLIEINEVPLTAMGLLRVIFIIFLAWLLSKLLGRGLNKLAAHNEVLSPSAIYTLGRIVHYLVLVLGAIIALSSIGLDFTKFALFASALGVGIGFGLQNLIGNFVSGLIILFEKSLKVGDFVELSSGLSGEVKEINMRGTLITTNDNIDIIVPNSDFVNNQVTNWTLRETYRRIHVPFGVAYGTDKDLVKQAALEAADEVKWTLSEDINRKPQVWLVQFGDSSLNFELVVWLKAEAVKRPGAVNAAYLWEIDTKLKQHGVEIPFPQRDLHLRSVFGEKDEAGLALLNTQRDNDSGPA